MAIPSKLLPVNCYHEPYRPGQAIRLVQFWFDRLGQPPLHITVQEVVNLAKIHPRYIYDLNMRSAVVIVDEKVDHNDYESGFVASGTAPQSRDLLIAHYQYPTYLRRKNARTRWQVYQLNLSFNGSYTQSHWEDYHWVMTHVDKIRYRPLRQRLRALAD